MLLPNDNLCRTGRIELTYLFVQTCKVENGYQCLEGSESAADVCTVHCGDGKRVGNEACDDGNDDAGDGCAADCTVRAKLHICTQRN